MKKKTAYNRDWEYYISRNTTIWTSSTLMDYMFSGFKRYKIKNDYYDHVRIHHGFLTGLYNCISGIGSVNHLIAELSEKLENKKYVNFLKKTFIEDGNKLIKLSKELKNDQKNLEYFFEFYGKCLAMLDITCFASKIITDKIEVGLKGCAKKDLIISYYSKPKKNEIAPIQRLEIDLKKINLKKYSTEKKVDYLYKKYSFLPVGFIGEPWNPKYFFDLLANFKEKKESRNNLINKKINPKVIKNLRILATISYLNEYRKSIYSQVSLIIRPVFDEIAKSNGLKNWQDLALLTHKEILSLFVRPIKFSKVIISRKQNPFAIRILNGKIDLLNNLNISKFEKLFNNLNSNSNLVTGTVANKGIYKGIVKVVKSHSDFKKFDNGDVLVATMTSVDFLPLMKKAGAIVTDEGGLASHAAIVSREFGIPCVVNTKMATIIFKNGDCIEVDANNGVVRKLPNP